MRAAFTLVELLVVIAIMAILVSLIVASANALGVGSKKNRSATILETVRQALEVTAAQSGSFAAAVEHPLAGSYATAGKPRPRFVRATAPYTDLARDVSGALGSASEQIALSGITLSELGTAQARLMLPDDIYADNQVPLLYGLARERIGVIGTKLAEVTRFRRLPKPVAGQVITNPDDLAAYPNAVRLVWSDVQPEGNKRTLDYVFGATNAGAELAKLGASYAPPNDAVANQHAYGRVWCEKPRTSGGEAIFKPGMLNDPERVPQSSPSWKRYRLRGLAIYDAWGVEILCATTTSGALRLMSAGRDGAFRWSPGSDGTLQTDAWATGPAGDDKDGSLDNVVSNIGGG